MRLIKPFPGWRPRPGLERQVAAPPYDVLDSDEARRLAAGNPHSFLHVSKAEIDLDAGIPAGDDRVYETARANFQRMRDDGVLVQDPRDCLYLYRLIMDGREQVGVVATAAVAAYRQNRIKKHEFTRPDKEADRTNHAQRIGAHSGPVFLIHRHAAAIDALVRQGMAAAPVNDFVADDGIRHTLWQVDDPELIERLTATFDALPAVYVADGHHRSAAAQCVQKRISDQLRAEGGAVTGEEPWNWFLTVLFPDSQVRILDYNRVVRDLNGLSAAAFLERISDVFTVTPSATPVRPARKHRFGLYLAGRWHELALDPARVDRSDPVARLDVALLSQHLLEPVLGITDPRRDTRIDFVGGSRGLAGLMARVDSGEMAAAFALYPTALADLMAVADAGQVMPPKSTWFEPKLRDGLVIQIF